MREVVTQKCPTTCYSTDDNRFPCTLHPDILLVNSSCGLLLLANLWRSPMTVEFGLSQEQECGIQYERFLNGLAAYRGIRGRGRWCIAAVVPVISKPTNSARMFKNMMWTTQTNTYPPPPWLSLAIDTFPAGQSLKMQVEPPSHSPKIILAHVKTWETSD